MRKDCIARELTMEVIVGAFMVMILLGLGYFTIILSTNKIFEKKYPIKMVFPKVMGLRNGDSIVVRGMTAGKVTNIKLTENGVSVTANLDNPITIHKGYTMSIVQTSILGGRQLEIDTGPENNEILPMDTVFKGIQPHDLMADAGEVINSLKKNIVDGHIVDNFSKTAKNLYEISERLNTGQGTIGKLLSPDDTLYNNLSDTVASLKEITSRIEKGQGTIGKLLSPDESLYNDLQSTVASLKNITARLESGEGTLGHLLSKDDTVYEDLASTMASLKVITKHLEDGDGLLGKMLTDDKLYNQLSGVINEAMEVLDDYRETSPVVTFTSVFFGAM